MVQFYFLAVCLNILGGLVLASGYLSERFPGIVSLKNLFYDKASAKIALISGMILVGVMKIISVFSGDVIVVGDFLPALTLLVSGFTLILDSADGEEGEESGLRLKLRHIFVDHSAIIGIIAVVAAVLHFLFPGVLFL